MDDITTIKTEEPKKTPTAPKKRSALFMTLASLLLVLLLGVFGWLAYWGYQNYLAVDESANSINQTTVTNTKTTEEKDLDAAAADLKADETLLTDDAEAQADDLNNIDITGI